MSLRHVLSCLIPAVAALLVTGAPARAAPAYDACTGTITSIPVVISSQGTWCLKGDLSTAMDSGKAISIEANNVTLDCNGFKVGGLAAGTATLTEGIVSSNLNTVIRACHVRGFRVGISVGADGAVVEDNRVEANTQVGIVAMTGAVIRRNLVLDTGGAPNSTATAISAGGSTGVSGNRVDGTVASPGNTLGGYGIYGFNPDGLVIEENIVVGIHAGSTGASPILIGGVGPRGTVSGNIVSGVGAVVALNGIGCPNGSLVIVRENFVLGFSVEDVDCTDGGSNWFN